MFLLASSLYGLSLIHISEPTRHLRISYAVFCPPPPPPPFTQKTAYEILRCLVGSEMCIRDRIFPVWRAIFYRLPRESWA
ncbi:hypothetical protein ACX3V1_21535 [Escherichia coli]